ncbi:hypothetical protein [Rivularia sp. PCC 7116]|uniref:hypothetical protein n=1 Tax=Rivularia sp. PCC 7116 TaxID=373994 RepID=UPI0002EAA469|nr:hypothetical protein [Rivularia sp. PCC 7116]
MNQILFAINEKYLLNEKGAVALTNNFEICPQDYQHRVESALALLSQSKKSIGDVIVILENIERYLK